MPAVTLEYLITVQHLSNLHNACKEGQFEAVHLVLNNKFKAFESINLKKDVNGMTHFDLVEIVHVRLLNIL